MSEADWWLCSSCQSLNNLSARKCYSCRKRKPKEAIRASEYLGYVPVMHEDGKVSLEVIVPPVPELQARQEAKPPPLRDPVLRDTLAVAPRPPHGARITYRTPIVPPPAPGYSIPVQSGPPPLVAVGPGPGASPVGWSAAGPNPAVADPGPRWPHWQDLLDVPKPEGERLRAAYATDVSGSGAAATAGTNTGLSRAMKTARDQASDQGRLFTPWPEADRL